MIEFDVGSRNASNDRAPNLGYGFERVGRDIEQSVDGEVSLRENGKISTIFRTGRGRDAIDYLTLKHEDAIFEVVCKRKQPLKDRRRNVVGEIRDEPELSPFGDFGEVYKQGIRLENVNGW